MNCKKRMKLSQRRDIVDGYGWRCSTCTKRDEDGNVVKDDNVVNAAVITTRVYNTRSKK
jgi:hypothetical protein